MFGYLFLELILPILRIALQGNQNYADSRRKDVSLFRFFARTLTLQFNFPKTKFLLSEAERLGFVQKFQKSYRLFTFFLSSHCERQDVAFFAFWWLFLRPIRRCLRNGQIVIWFLLGCFFCPVPANGRKGSEYGVGKTILLLQDISSICLKLQLLGRRTVTTNGG